MRILQKHNVKHLQVQHKPYKQQQVGSMGWWFHIYIIYHIYAHEIVDDLRKSDTRWQLAVRTFYDNVFIHSKRKCGKPLALKCSKLIFIHKTSTKIGYGVFVKCSFVFLFRGNLLWSTRVTWEHPREQTKELHPLRSLVRISSTIVLLMKS